MLGDAQELRHIVTKANVLPLVTALYEQATTSHRVIAIHLEQQTTALVAREAPHLHAVLLEKLRLRLGRDNLSMEEWNALVGAASHLRVEALLRQRRLNER